MATAPCPLAWLKGGSNSFKASKKASFYPFFLLPFSYAINWESSQPEGRQVTLAIVVSKEMPGNVSYCNCKGIQDPGMAPLASDGLALVKTELGKRKRKYQGW